MRLRHSCPSDGHSLVNRRPQRFFSTRALFQRGRALLRFLAIRLGSLAERVPRPVAISGGRLGSLVEGTQSPIAAVDCGLTRLAVTSILARRHQQSNHGQQTTNGNCAESAADHIKGSALKKTIRTPTCKDLTSKVPPRLSRRQSPYMCSRKTAGIMCGVQRAVCQEPKTVIARGKSCPNAAQSIDTSETLDCFGQLVAPGQPDAPLPGGGCYARAAARSLALRARGLSSISSGLGVIGRGVSSFSLWSVRNACLTSRSSRE